MDHWQLAYLGIRQIPRELSEFELATFFTFSSKDLIAISAGHRPETRVDARGRYLGKLRQNQGDPAPQLLGQRRAAVFDDDGGAREKTASSPATSARR